MKGGIDMITVIKSRKKAKSTFYVECVCDTAADVEKLAEKSRKQNWIAGSTAFVIETGSIYMLNSSNEWRGI